MFGQCDCLLLHALVSFHYLQTYVCSWLPLSNAKLNVHLFYSPTNLCSHLPRSATNLSSCLPWLLYCRLSTNLFSCLPLFKSVHLVLHLSDNHLPLTRTKCAFKVSQRSWNHCHKFVLTRKGTCRPEKTHSSQQFNLQAHIIKIVSHIIMELMMSYMITTVQLVVMPRGGWYVRYNNGHWSASTIFGQTVSC